jgi:hypothetical protein
MPLKEVQPLTFEGDSALSVPEAHFPDSALEIQPIVVFVLAIDNHPP